MYTYIYICNKKQQNHIQSCITVENLDFVNNTISGTFFWNNWFNVQFVLNCNKHFRFMLLINPDFFQTDHFINLAFLGFDPDFKLLSSYHKTITMGDALKCSC